MIEPCKRYPACGGPLFCDACDTAFIDEASAVLEDMWTNPPAPLKGGLGDLLPPDPPA